MNRKKMKKYFMQGTAEELKFGDMIVLDLTKDMPNGNVKHHHFECKFIPELIPILLEEGIIEVQNIKEKKPKNNPKPEQKPLDFVDDKCPMDDVIKSVEDLELRVDKLEEMVSAVYDFLSALSEQPANSTKSKRNARKGRK